MDKKNMSDHDLGKSWRTLTEAKPAVGVCWTTKHTPVPLTNQALDKNQPNKKYQRENTQTALVPEKR